MKSQIFITLLLSTFIALLGIGIIIPIMPMYASDLGASGLWLGFIIAAFSLSRAVFQPIVGNLSDKIGRKGFLVTGLLIYGLVGIWLASAESVMGLIGIRIVHGVGSAMIVPIAMAYVGSLAPEGEEGRYMSYLNTSIFFGIGFGPVFGGFFTEMYGMASAFYFMSGLSFIAFFMVCIYMPKQTSDETSIKKYLPVGQLVASMLKNRHTLAILTARMATMIFVVPTMAFLPLLIVRDGYGTAIAVGVIMGCRTLANGLFQVPFGKLVDRYSKKTLLFGSCIVASLFVVSIPFTTSFMQLLILFVCLGIVEAMIWASLGAFAVEEGRNHYGYGSMMGIFNFSMSMGILIGAILSGSAMDCFGLDYSFYTTGVAVFMLSSLALWMMQSAAGRENNNKVVQ